MGEGVLFTYRQAIADGEFQRDGRQLLAAEKLQSLHNALKGYTANHSETGWRERFGLGGRKRTDVPMGLYIYGSAGVGKSMLMDMFFAGAPLDKKRRVHFHEFMIEVHGLLKKFRDADDSDDVIISVAKEISAKVYLLCFDEFHVGNITDAMILGRLFSALLEWGTVIVATSNIAPDDLYKDGLQRDRFLPFIELLKQRFDILHLDGAEDYRMRHLHNLPLYFDCTGEQGRADFASAFEDLSGRKQGEPCELSVGNRKLQVPEYVGKICRYGFTDLCGKPLGVQDYMALCERFSILFLQDVPIFTSELRNEMKRFILLVDVMYEKRVVLCMSAESEPEKLGQGRDHAFEFQRTYSRLQEMRSDDYSAAVLEGLGV